MWCISISDGANLGGLVFERRHWWLIVWHVSAIVKQDPAVLSLRVVLFRVYQVIGLMSLTIHGLVFVLGTLVQLLGHQPALLGGVVSVDVVWLHLGQVELLWTKD